MNSSSYKLFCGALGSVIGFIIAIFSNNHLGSYNSTPTTMDQLYPPEGFNTNMIAAENLGSSIWCNIRFDSTKFCKFNNLYYIPKFKGHFFFLINEFSVISGVDDLKKLSLSTVQNHSGLYLKLILIKSTHHLLRENFTVANMNSFILKRFKPDNIMHVIHDDLLPLFVTYKELCSGNISLCSSTYQLLLMDSPNDNEPYYEWYKHFSIHTPIILGKLKNPLCIKKGYFGLSNSSIWFQYGFKTTQGPVLESNINGFILAEFSDFIKKQFGVKREINLDHSDILPILLFSRKLNRKIINEAAMQDSMEYIAESTLKKNFSIINLDLSTNNSTSIINYLHQSQLLVGMHGSAMILAIFMPRGSRIIELFPFGIQPNFVSPLRALCQNKHIYYNYESWVNMNESNTITHPEYPPLHGGILHLEKTKQEEIIKVKTVPPVECCHNPVYLFRMFQDTIVDESFFTMFHSFVSKQTDYDSSKQTITKQKLQYEIERWYFPPPVFNVSCICYDQQLKLSWNYPFMHKGITFSIATSNGVLAISEETNISLEMNECEKNKQLSFSVWIKVIDGTKESFDYFEECEISYKR